MQIEQLKAIIEAALLAASQPLSVPQLSELFIEEDDVDRAQIAVALEMLAADSQGRGVELMEVGSGFRYQVRQDVHPWVSRMWTEKPSRYSRALLETLALIAYRQPITRPEIEQIRGVVVSSNIIKTMEEREWIRVVGHRDVPGKPALFGTTRSFLDYFNLKSLDELPPLSEIRDMEDPQLRLDDEPFPPRVIRDLPIDPDAEVAENENEEAAGEEHEVPEHPEEVHVENEPADDVHGDVSEDHLTESAQADADAAPEDRTEENQAEVNRAEESQTEETPQHHEPQQQADSTPSNHDKLTTEAESVAETHSSTADEAADHADADEGTAEQDTEEYRA